MRALCTRLALCQGSSGRLLASDMAHTRIGTDVNVWERFLFLFRSM